MSERSLTIFFYLFANLSVVCYSFDIIFPLMESLFLLTKQQTNCVFHWIDCELLTSSVLPILLSWHHPGTKVVRRGKKSLKNSDIRVQVKFNCGRCLPQKSLILIKTPDRIVNGNHYMFSCTWPGHLPAPGHCNANSLSCGSCEPVSSYHSSRVPRIPERTIRTQECGVTVFLGV